MIVSDKRIPQALILRRTVRFVSKDEGASSEHWNLLRDGRCATSSG
jgi:hypothetical protein